ncbi:MAG: HYR domain-containing protein, partial [Flavobacteriales bacterium]|nr:HYR domain-containing protein [Flavobacteriales bacterium]
MADTLRRKECGAIRTLMVLAALAAHAFFDAHAQGPVWDWMKTQDAGSNEYVRDIAVETATGNIYAVGTYTSNSGTPPPFNLPPTAGSADAFIVKLGPAGNLLWSKAIGSNQPDAAMGVAVGPSGHVAITGYHLNSIPTLGLGHVGNSDAFVSLFDPNGAHIWSKNIAGSQNDEGTSVVITNNQVVAFGSFTNQGSLTGVLSSLGLTLGRRYAYLNAFDLAGTNSWSLVGSSNSDILSERIAADANTVYVIGFTEGNRFSWVNSSGITLSNVSIFNTNIGFVSAVSSTGTPLWSRLIDNPDDSDVEFNGIAAGCGGVYITGRSHNSTVFPGGAVSTIPGVHDYFYLASLNPGTGSTQWVRTARSSTPHGMVGNDITIGRNQQIMVSGSMIGTVTTDGGSMIAGDDEPDLFIARFAPDGTAVWYDRSVNDGDEYPLAIAASTPGRYVVGGQYENDLVLGPLTQVNGSGNDLFVAHFSDPDHLGFTVDPSRFTQPGPYCWDPGPVNLNDHLVDHASSVISSSISVLAPNNALGAPDNVGANFTAPGADLVLDLGDTIQAGETVRLWWRSNTSGQQAQLLASSSLDLITFGPSNTFTSSSNSWTMVSFSVPTAARFIRLRRSSSNAYTSLQVDAIRTMNNTVSGGAWSGGPHVTASGTFTPTGPGAYPVTYTVTQGTCVYSTSKTIRVDAASAGGTVSGGGSYCPGANGVLTLSGHTGNVGRWMNSSDGISWTSIAHTSNSYPWSGIVGTMYFRAAVQNANCPIALSGIDTVTVSDVTPPVVICPLNDTLYTPVSACTSPYSVPATIGTDNCPGAMITGNIYVAVAGGGSVAVNGIEVQTAGPLALGAGSVIALPLGIHQFTDTLFDGSGNHTVCNWSITVLDNTPPTIACPPSPVDLNSAVGSCSGVLIDLLNLVTIGGDNCSTDADLLLTQTPAAGTVMNDGDPATVIVADGSGNSSTCTFSIQVLDTEPPVFDNCPSPSDQEFNPPMGACSHRYVFPTINSTDNCDPDTESDYQTFLREEGNPIWQDVTGQTDHVLAAGTHLLYEVHTDDAGNADTCHWTVTVRDDEAPVITVPADIIVSADGNACGAMVNFAVGVSDNCAVLDTTFSHASGSSFPVGSTMVTVDANDIHGNAAAQASFTITVVDNTAPTITCPGNVSRNISNLGTCTGAASWAQPVFSDDCGSSTLFQTAGLASGSQFPLGLHPITYTVQDAAGNTASCSFTVAINDISAPTITCPLYDTLPIPLGPGCSLSFPDLRDSLTVTDCSPWTNTMVPAAGTLFTQDTVLYVTMWVEDSAGNGIWNDHWVHIADLAPPTINCPSDISVNADPGACGAVVNYVVPTGTDNCAATTIAMTAGLASGSFFPVGTTTMSYLVTDAAGLTASCSFSVTATDNSIPALVNCPMDMVITAAPGACDAVANWTEPIVSDNCSATLTRTGPASGSSFAVGTTTTITYSATDGNNTATCGFNVTVIAPVVDLVYGTTTACQGSAVIMPSMATPAGGTFIDADQSGTVDPSTGAFDPSIATPGPHTIGYTLSGDCTILDWFTVTVVAVPTASILYAASPYCSGTGTATVSRTGATGGSYSSTAGLAINVWTGDVDLAASTPGNYTVTYTIATGGVCGEFSTTAPITITPSSSNTTTASACDNYTWSVDGQSYTASGTYTSVSGCHTETLVLTITPSTSNTTTASACDSYTWIVDGQSYTASGTYTSVSGCHTETLVLTITPSTSNTTT